MKINKNFNEQINNDRQTLRKRYLEAFPERIQSDNNINTLNNNTSLPNPKKKGYYKRNNITAEPFVYKEIGETSLINSRIIPAQSTIDDAVRLGKFAISTKGIIFAAKQTALQAINNYNWSKLWNPLGTYGSAAPILHLSRSWLPMLFPNKNQYEDWLKTNDSLGKAIPSNKIKISLQQFNNINKFINTQHPSLSNLKIPTDKWKGSLYPPIIPSLNKPGTALAGNKTDPYANKNTSISLPQTPSVFATKTYYALTYNNILKANDVNEKDLRYPSYVVNESQYNQLQLKKHMENYSLSTKEDAYPNDYKQLNNADKEKEETKLRNKEIPDNLESYREQKYPQKNQTLNTEQNNEGQLPFIHLTRPGEEQQIQNLYKIPQYSIINNKNLSNKSREEFDRESAIDKYNAWAPGNDISSDFKDFIPLKIYDINNDRYIILRAFLTGLTESPTAEWNSNSYIGRPEKIYTYSGAERTFTFSVKVVAFSRQEMKPIWQKINAIMGLNYPTYNENKEQPLMKGPFVKLTLGDLYKQTPGFFNSISIEYDDEFPWEIDKINNNDKIKLPMGASITFGFTVVADEALRNGGKQIFGLKDEWIN